MQNPGPALVVMLETRKGLRYEQAGQTILFIRSLCITYLIRAPSAMYHLPILLTYYVRF